MVFIPIYASTRG